MHKTNFDQMLIGFTASCFDLLHAGHLSLLEEAKRKCGKLVVGLHVDPSIERKEKNTPIQSLVERAMALRACGFVDEVVPYQTENELLLLLKLLKPDVRFIGSDYIEKPFTGCTLPGIKIEYVDRSHGLSSSGLRRKIKNA